MLWPITSKRTGGRNQLWELLQTFSDEAMNAAKRKAIEQGYSFERAEIPFEETLINLSHCRDILVQAIESTAIVQLPLKIQREMLLDTSKVAAQLQSLVNGIDAIVPFTSAVDELVTTVWYSRIENIHGEVLGLQQKLNQLKVLERSLRELSSHADKLRSNEIVGEEIANKLATIATTLNELLAESRTKASEIERTATASKEAEQRAAASFAVVQQTEKSLADSAVAARNSAAELDALRQKGENVSKELVDARGAIERERESLANFRAEHEARLEKGAQDFSQRFGSLEEASKAEYARLTKDVADKTAKFGIDVDTLVKAALQKVEETSKKLQDDLRQAEMQRATSATTQLTASKTAFDTASAAIQQQTKERLAEIERSAAEIVQKNEKTTAERFAELKNLEDQIREKIRLATNYQLFHAFQTRQLTIAKGVNFWKYALFTSVGISFAATIVLILYLVFGHPTYDAAFFLKLGFTIPIVYAVHFCSTQYSRERQLEEDYAFKGNISISLEPYRELVEKLIDKNNTADSTKYLDFVLTSIDRVFTPPISSIKAASEQPSIAQETTEASKSFSKILGSVTELIQSLTKLKV